MIRVAIRIADDIRRALLAVKESRKYERFLEQLKDLEKENRYREINSGENDILYRRRITVLNEIHEHTDAILHSLVGDLRSKKREGFYLKKAIKAYARFARHLLANAKIMIPEIYPDLEYELKNSTSYFDLSKIL